MSDKTKSSPDQGALGASTDVPLMPVISAEATSMGPRVFRSELKLRLLTEVGRPSDVSFPVQGVSGEEWR